MARFLSTRRLLAGLCTIIVSCTAPCSPAATVAWIGADDGDFFDRQNWRITSGTIGDAGVGAPPPAGVIEPAGTPGYAGVQHELSIGGGSIAAFTTGSILIDPPAGGSLRVHDDATLRSGVTGIQSSSSLAASVFVADQAKITAQLLDGVQVETSHTATVALTGAVSNLFQADATIDMLTSPTTPLPRPCVIIKDQVPPGAINMNVLPALRLNGMAVGPNDVQIGEKDPDVDDPDCPPMGKIWLIKGPVIPDVDLDNDVDIDDINALTTTVASGLPYSPLFDLNGDGLVDLSDVDAWLTEAGELNLGVGRAYLFGDGNLDGLVDVGDFNVWNQNKFTMTSLWSEADFNADGLNDVADFNSWNANKFVASDQIVPEPSPLLLGLLGLAGWLALDRHKVMADVQPRLGL